MSRRTPAEEMAAFKRRVEELARKEARCPACKKAATTAEQPLVELLAAGLEPAAYVILPGATSNEARICSAHQRIRHELAFPPGWRRWS